MLAAVAPAQVDAAKTSVRFDKDGLELGLVHTEREEWVIWATADSRDVIVGTEWAHEHFTPEETAGYQEAGVAQQGALAGVVAVVVTDGDRGVAAEGRLDLDLASGSRSAPTSNESRSRRQNTAVSPNS